MMEQEKREYKKNREREKEKERERERVAMDRMAMERKRQEAEHRVIFRNDYGTFLLPHDFISALDKVSFKEEWFLWSLNSLTRMMWSGPELETSTSSSRGRGTTTSLPGTETLRDEFSN